MMKKGLFYLGMATTLALTFSCGPKKGTTGEGGGADSSAYAGPPYTVALEEFTVPDMPGLHSYTHAIYMDKIIMFGGRINGLHGQSYNFNRSNSNDSIYVVDTHNWSSDTAWTVYSLHYSKIRFTAEPRQPLNLSQFHANNAEFFTQNYKLYVIGGLLGATVNTQLKDPKNPNSGVTFAKGVKAKSGQAASAPATLPYMTAIDLQDLVAAVMSGSGLMRREAIRQAKNDSLAITGGEVSVMNNVVNLVFGWTFNFTNPFYSHQVKTFTFTDTGLNLQLSAITTCATCTDCCPNGPDSDTAGYFRRRDGSISPVVDPKDGSQALLYYAGVFKQSATNFVTPVWIGANSAAEQPFTMLSNVYTCQVLPVYSAANHAFYASMIGGMKNATYTGGAISMPVALSTANTVQNQTNPNDFNFVPFSSQITTIKVDANHNFSQYLQPDSFPAIIRPVVLPAIPADTTFPGIPEQTLPAGTVMFNGAESEMHWTLDPTLLKPNGVVDYDAFIAKYSSGTTVGYLHGGILSAVPNAFGNFSAHYTVASNRVFKVKIIPLSK